MRRKIGKLIAKIDGAYLFVDAVYDYGWDALRHRGRHCGAETTVLRVVDAEELAWTGTDEGLAYWLADRDEEPVECACAGEPREYDLRTTEGRRAYFADHGGAGIYDLSYVDEYWPQLRAIGLTEDAVPFFDCTGSGPSVILPQACEAIYDEALMAEVIAWQCRQGEPQPGEVAA